MGFMNAIKSLFAGSDDATRRDSRTYVVDGARLVDEKTGRRMAPREQVQLLNALARVAKQEGLQMQVVLESDKRLREVDEQDEFNGIGVYFAPDTDALVALAMKLCRKGHNSVLVSSGVTMESRATEAGLTVLCSGTFRKAFLSNGLGGNGGGYGGNGNRGGRNGDRRGGRDRHRDRGDRDRGPRHGGNGGPHGGPRGPQSAEGSGGAASVPSAEGAPAAMDGAAPEAASQPQPAPQGNAANPVNQLIDLVD